MPSAGHWMGLDGHGRPDVLAAYRRHAAGRVGDFRRAAFIRGPGDAVNAALNYGYGILYTHVWGAVMNAGLEPFCRVYACGPERQTVDGAGYG